MSAYFWTAWLYYIWYFNEATRRRLSYEHYEYQFYDVGSKFVFSETNFVWSVAVFEITVTYRLKMQKLSAYLNAYIFNDMQISKLVTPAMCIFTRNHCVEWKWRIVYPIVMWEPIQNILQFNKSSVACRGANKRAGSLCKSLIVYSKWCKL